MVNRDRDTIRVLVVDDHELLRSGVRLSLTAQEDIEIVGEADCGEQALAVAEKLQPDVVLMDLKMPGMGGVAATRALREARPDCRVLVLSSFHDPTLVREAMQAGASGYVVKDVSSDEVADAIRSAHEGRTHLASQAAEALIASIDQSPSLGSDLSDRQREVLSLIAKGHSNQEIAERLFLSPSTVRYHVSEILVKLGAANRAAASALAVKHGIIDRA
jgi:NarL family two-component system response regulator LiaR